MIVVIGSSRGVGKATALTFLDAGAKVVLKGRSILPLEETEMEFRQMGFDPLTIVGDVRDVDFHAMAPTAWQRWDSRLFLRH